MIVAIIGAVVFAGLLALDLITKWAAAAAHVAQPDFFLGIVRLYYTENTGMAFSLFNDNEVAMAVVTAFTVVLIIGIAVLFFTFFKKNTPARITLAVIEAGAVGNLVDRLFLGYVRDFVDVSPLHFGVCNIADFCITFGGVALLFILLFIGKDSFFPLKKKWREQAEAEEREKETKEAKNGDE